MKYKIYARLTLLILCQITMLISYRCGSSAGGTVAGGGGSSGGGGGAGVTIDYFQLQVGSSWGGGATDATDLAEHLAIDSDGNIYITGGTSSDLGEALAGPGDLYVMKIDKTGSIQWASQFGELTEEGFNGDTSADGADYANRIILDSSRNIYLTGSTGGNLGEDDQSNNDLYVAKLDSSGTWLWMSHLGNVSEDALTGHNSAAGADNTSGLVLDAAGNIYIAAGTTGSLGEAGAMNQDIVLLKLASDGSYLWITHIGEVTEDAVNGDSTADGTEWPVGNPIITGTDQINFTFNTDGNLGEATAGGNDIGFVQFDSSGNVDWIRQVGDTTEDTLNGDSTAGGDDSPTGLVKDSDGNFYIAGSTAGNLGEAGALNHDIFLMKLDSSLVPQWVKQIGEVTEDTLTGDTSADGSEVVFHVTISGTSIYIVGRTDGNLGEPGATGNDMYVVKANTSGAFLWIKQIGETTEDSLGGDGSADGGDSAVESVFFGGKLVVVGFTSGSLFDTTGGAQDIVVLTMDTDGNFAAP